jgi:hypothetical protein
LAVQRCYHLVAMRSWYLALALVTLAACASSSDEGGLPTGPKGGHGVTSGGGGATGGDTGSAGHAGNAGGGGHGGDDAGGNGAGGAGGDAGQGGGPTCPQGTTSPDLVAWYRFDDPLSSQITDSSMYGHHGSASAGVQIGVPGRFCGGVRFDGNLSNVDVPYSAELDITGDITIEAWVFLDAPVSYNRMLVRKVLQYQMSVSVVPQPNLLEFYSQPLGFARASNPVPFGKWIHAAVSHDGTTARLYLDGELVDAVPLAGSLPSNNASLKLGGDGFNQVAPDGGMDEVKIWRVVRSEQQICEDGFGSYNPNAAVKCSY